MASLVNPSPSSTTATGLPLNGTVVNTSTCWKPSRFICGSSSEFVDHRENAFVFEPARRAAPVCRNRARGRARRVPAARAGLHERRLSLGEHAPARRIGRPRHGGARGVWRAGAAGVRHRAGARRDRQGLLRDGDGGPGRGRCSDPRDLDLCAGIDQIAHPPCGGQRRLPAGDLHDRARRRHRRRQLQDQCRPGRQPPQAQRGQDPDQPRRGGRHVCRLYPRRQKAGARGHRLRAGRERDAGVFGHRHLSHDGRREFA